VIIQELINRTILLLLITCQNGHQEIKYSFQQNLGLHLLKICDKKANKIRESINTREGRSNIKY
jgi:hypothetical protein